MASVSKNTSIRKYQEFTKQVYGLSDDRYFALGDMITNMEMNMAKELAQIFKNNCHVCQEAPCICDFRDIVRFKS